MYIYKYIHSRNTYITQNSNIIELVCNGFMYRNTMHRNIELKQYIDMLVIMSLHVDLDVIYNILSFMDLYFIMWVLHSLMYENYSIHSKHLSRKIHYKLNTALCILT